jgi:outer membrane lipoprotein-sorting protein
MCDLTTLPALMYRPGWAGLTLSGKVRRYSEAQRRGRQGDSSELRGSLSIATHGRYRADLIDEFGDRSVEICDGQSTWTIRDGIATHIQATDSSIPFGDLLTPTWVLANYGLHITGQSEYGGRPAYIAVGSPRPASKAGAGVDQRQGHLTALIDAELGFLLRYEKTGRGNRTEAAEFSVLSVDAPEAADPALFDPPAGVQFGQGTSQQPSAGADEGDSAPDRGSEALSDDMVNLLYRAGLQQRFSAQLREWADGSAIARSRQAAVTSARSEVVRQLAQFAADRSESVDVTAQIQVAMPGCYQIETIAGSGSTLRRVVCDGRYLWQISPDRFYRLRAEPPPAGIARVIDPAWLLDRHNLSVGRTISIDGRPGLRITAEPTDVIAQQGIGPLSHITVPADKIEAVIDIQLGIALRLEWSYGGHLLLTAKLSNVTKSVDPAVFQVEPPPGSLFKPSP